MTTKKKRVVRRKPPVARQEPRPGAVTRECRCGALLVEFEGDDRVIIRTTTERGAGWLKLAQFAVCSHCDTEIRIAPMPCWVGKISGELWTTKTYMGAGIEGEQRRVPPRGES